MSFYTLSKDLAALTSRVRELEDAIYPRPANKWDFCYCCGTQIVLGKEVHWRDERTVCSKCAPLYDNRKPVEAGNISSRAKRVRKPKKVEAVK